MATLASCVIEAGVGHLPGVPSKVKYHTRVELASSGRVNAGYAKFSRSRETDVRFGVRCGLPCS
jgi:hypothetical protein